MTAKAVAMSRSHKAARLVSGGHVHKITDQCEVFEVFSPESEMTYTVVLKGAKLQDGVCNCRYGTSRKPEMPDCAHVIAAKVELSRPADPFVGLPSAEYPYGRPR